MLPDYTVKQTGQHQTVFYSAMRRTAIDLDNLHSIVVVQQCLAHLLIHWTRYGGREAGIGG